MTAGLLGPAAVQASPPNDPGSPAPSTATSRVNPFVGDHREAAERLGRRLAREIHDPDAFAAMLRRGLAGLSDPAYLAGQQRVAPGIGQLHGVRMPLLDAVGRAFHRAAGAVSTDVLLRIADRLLHEDHQEPHWLAMGFLERTIAGDPERTWQLVRRAARLAGNWISIDTLAHPAGRGILLEPYRWAELEQLAYSPSRWERRLIGSTIATLPFLVAPGDAPARAMIVRRGLPLLATLIGDAEPDVQKALSWAYRSLAAVDLPAVEAALQSEAALAAETGDGHRAWVVRDAAAKLSPPVAEAVRARLAGIRRQSGTASTSAAARIAAAFGALPDPAGLPEAPLFETTGDRR